MVEIVACGVDAHHPKPDEDDVEHYREPVDVFEYGC